MHFRTWYLGPLAVYAAYKHVETNGLFERPVPLVVAGVTGGYSVASLLLLQTNGLSIADSPNIHVNRFSVISADPGWLVFALVGAGVVVFAVAEWSLPSILVYSLAVLEVLVLPQWMWWYSVLFIPLVVVAESDHGWALGLLTVFQLQLLLGGAWKVLKILDLFRKSL
jgi:hypothetical protein